MDLEKLSLTFASDLNAVIEGKDLLIDLESGEDKNDD